jgi:Lrp/AsnC family transcriptional regulator for asnA, asnC and gidA
MDKMDYLILSEMLKNAQTSLLKIAIKLDISPLTVRKRYEKMIKEGVIRKSVISIDLSKLGYEGKVLLLITNTPNVNKATTIEALKKIQNIIIVSEIIGPIDILAIAPVIDLNSIKTLVSEVKKIPSVQRVEIVCTNNTMFPIDTAYGRLMSQRSIELSQKNP